ncbi:hypothetical protein MMC25_004168 [Agyrium rufum]|nr:hypothetical protein [Agyrium rufum]
MATTIAISEKPQVKPSAVLHRDLHTKPEDVVSASGLYLTLSSGRKVLDASGGAAVSCIGHGDLRVQEAIAKQIKRLDYCHSLFFSCPPLEDLTRLLVDSTNGLMSRAYIVNSGSEAMEAAIKLARQYFLELSPPQPQRMRFIARQESYHGNTIGALGISGHKARRAVYEPMLSLNVSHVSPCNPYRGLKEGETIKNYIVRLANELDEEFQRVDSDTVCAFVAEPVVGAALGCVPAVSGYLKAMKAVCDNHGALLILDEVMCGMGRSGTMHAWQQEGVVPDIQTMGKCLGGGYVPVAGMLIGHRVIDVLESGTGAFMHGQTYQGHAMVCAGALEVQRIIESENLLENVRIQGKHLESRLRKLLTSHENVGDIRGRGLFWGIEFVKNKATKEPFETSRGIALAVHNQSLQQDPGIMIYPGTGSVDGKRGDHIIIAPPFNIKAEDIDVIVDAVKSAIDTVFGNVNATNGDANGTMSNSSTEKPLGNLEGMPNGQQSLMMD